MKTFSPSLFFSPSLCLSLSACFFLLLPHVSLETLRWACLLLSFALVLSVVASSFFYFSWFYTSLLYAFLSLFHTHRCKHTRIPTSPHPAPSTTHTCHPPSTIACYPFLCHLCNHPRILSLIWPYFPVASKPGNFPHTLLHHLWDRILPVFFLTVLLWVSNTDSRVLAGIIYHNFFFCSSSFSFVLFLLHRSIKGKKISSLLQCQNTCL